MDTSTNHFHLYQAPDTPYHLDSSVQYDIHVYGTNSYQPLSLQSSSSSIARPLMAPSPTALISNNVYLVNDAHLPSSMANSPTPQAHVSPVQVATPPDSAHEEETTVVSVSTAFHPGSHSNPPDLILMTTDSVLFYVHSSIIRKSSERAFSTVLNAPITNTKLQETVFPVPDTSEVLNVIMHCLYGTSCAQHSPSFDVLEVAVDRMPYYRVSPAKLIVPGTPLYTFILSHAPLYPLRLYALAAHHGIHELAVHTSSHLLAIPLSSIQDNIAQKMGAIYLNRLVHLHMSRVGELKNILLNPPVPHPATKQCTFEDQKRLTRAWALVAAYLAWDARPDLSTYSIRSALTPLLEDLPCELCNKGLKDRIKDVVVQWANVKRTV